MDDVTVYQCPECNFNADNLNELDSHMIEYHSASTESRPSSQQRLNTSTNNAAASSSIVSALIQNEIPIRAADRMTSAITKDPVSAAGKNTSNQIIMVNGGGQRHNNVNVKNSHHNHHNHDVDEDEENEHMVDGDDGEDHGNEDEDEDFFNERPTKFHMQNDYKDEGMLDDEDEEDYYTNSHQQEQQAQTSQSKTNDVSAMTTAAVIRNTTANNTPTRVIMNISDSQYERQYACKQCEFFTNNPRAVLYHRKEVHNEKINVHECQYCQYASQYSGKVERHTMMRHKFEIANGGLGTSGNPPSNNKKEPVDVDDEVDNDATNGSGATNGRFQCNKCPCKYKRSSDLSKHLRLKHGLNTNHLNVYAECVELNTRHSNGNGQINGTGSDDFENDENEDEYNDTMEMSQTNHSLNTSQPGPHQRVYNNRNFNQLNLKKVQTSTSTTSTPGGGSQPTAQPLPRRFPANSSKANHSAAALANPYQLVCPYCTYTANIAQSGEYLVHVKDHLCGKTFRCVLCSSVYKYRGDCVVHLKRKHQKADMIAHSYVDKFNLDAMDVGEIFGLLKPKQQDEPENEEKLFGCTYCDYKANYKGDVYKHQTRRHPGTMKQVNMLASMHHYNSANMANQSLNESHVLANCSNQSSGNNSVNNSFNNGNGGVGIDDLAKYNMAIGASDGSGVSKFYQHTNENGGHKFYNGQKLSHNNNNGGQVKSNNQRHEQMHENGYEDGEDEIYGDEDENMHGEDDLEGDEIDYDDEDMMTGGQVGEGGVYNEFGEDGVGGSGSGGGMIEDELDEEDDEDFFNERQMNGDGASGDGIHSSSSTSLGGRYACKFCTFVAKSQAKLNVHLTTHYNLKRFMCPICKRRANFKWDIQKHLRKIHNNFTDEVICLSEVEARKSIGNYIETKPYNSFDSAAIISAASAAAAAAALSGGVNGKMLMNGGVDSQSDHSSTMGDGVERKYKCSLCMRTSKWQWDVKKHLRTVHKGQQGEVLVIECGKSMSDTAIRPPPSNGSGSSNYASSSTSSIISQHIQQQQQQQNAFQQQYISSPGHQYGSPNSSSNNNFMGSDTTGNKKFRCSICPYRSNWKADSYRHLRKRHGVLQPSNDDVIVLSSDEAANTLEEYERIYGVNVRKRARFDAVAAAAAAATAAAAVAASAASVASATNIETTMVNDLNVEDVDGVDMDGTERKRLKTTDSSSVVSTSTSGSSKNTIDHKYMGSNGIQECYPGEEDEQQQTVGEINENSSSGVERLPVSIAELNIKPYKCLNCGFRSDRKSDTLRHIRVKHEVDALHAFKFLRIMSIKEASETIEEYESTRLFRKSTPRVVSRDYALINSLVQQTTSASNSPLTTQTLKPTTMSSSSTSHLSAAAASPVSRASPNLPLPTSTSLTKVIPTTAAATTNNIRLPMQSAVKTTNIKSAPLASLDYFRCPICLFKNRSRLVMKKHLANHYYINDLKQNPVYSCNVCGFKAAWQFTVKKHILSMHVANPNAFVVKLNSTNQKNNSHQNGQLKKKLKVLIRPMNGNLRNKPVQSTTNDVVKTISNTNDMNGTHIYHDEIDQHDNYGDENDESQQHMIKNEFAYRSTSDMKNASFAAGETSMIGGGGGGGGCVDDANIPKKTESIMLTDHDGNRFEATYLVSNGPGTGSGGGSLNYSLNLATASSGKKKMFYCQTCPYKTNNYCNLKQHLVQHRFRDGFFKCRYCPYYVSMIRLLKQHEILHGDYTPRDNIKPEPLINQQQSASLVNNHFLHHHHQRLVAAAGSSFSFPK